MNRGPKAYAVLVLDLLVAAIVISSALAALLPAIEPAVFKARFTEVLIAMAGERATLIERHAHTGAWAEAVAAAGESPEQRGEKSRASYHVSTAEGGVVAAGTLSGRLFTADMRPAVAHATSQWSVVWLCGARQPPAGWAVAPGGARFDLPEPLGLSVCRAQRSS